MPHSHHSHSGQFCKHAKSTLEDVVKTAIAKGMTTLALTEHMPRDLEDFYPEEIEDYRTANDLAAVSDDFYAEATRLRTIYGSKINLPIGFEGEWIRPSTLSLIKAFQQKYPWDIFLGSVHHALTIPIDFDRATYERAREAAGGTDEKLAEAYFDAQFEMLDSLKPRIVGHFDLTRLLSDDHDASFRQWDGVWEKVMRNLSAVAKQGGLLEINTAAWRKGLKEPYPSAEICQEFMRLGGKGFVLSDDSHGVEQVATNYGRVIDFLKETGITCVYALEAVKDAAPQDADVADGGVQFDFVKHKVEDLKNLEFWKLI